MTGVALAINENTGAPVYSARDFRNAMAALSGWDGVPLAGRQGVRPMGGASANVVSLSGSTLTVGLHTAQVTPGWSSTTGSYLVALTATETHPLTPAAVGNPRKDIVIGRVYDHDENPSTFRKYQSEYIAGTAGPSPSEPAVPQGAIRLATVDVPASGGGSAVVTVNHTYAVAAGGVLPVRSQAERDGIVDPHPGMVVDRIDKGWLEHYYSGAWRSHRQVITPGVLADITHPLTAQIVNLTGNSGWYVYDGTQWLPHIITAELQQTTTQNIASNASTATAIVFQGEIQDSHNGHSTVTNQSRYTVPRTGVYQVSGMVIFGPNANSYRTLRWRVNGTGTTTTGIVTGSSNTVPGTGAFNTHVTAKTMQLTLTAGDWVELVATQNSGVTLPTALDSDNRANMSIVWLRQS